MARDAELDRLHAEQERTFEKQQAAFQEMKRQGDEMHRLSARVMPSIMGINQRRRVTRPREKDTHQEYLLYACVCISESHATQL